VTKHGKPVIKIVPARQAEDNIFGYMADKAKVVGDILAPITKDQDWDALK
jgi:antitoxin (DNA-binding transcriptional repressor) of toxin-antitoxin stability system